MKRTDVHRPSVINTTDYEFVAFEHIKIIPGDLGACQYQIQQRERIQAHMKRTGGTYSHHDHGGNCMVCGNVLATYTILFYHAKTNSYVRAGEECATKIDMQFDTAGFARFKQGMRADAKFRTGKQKAKELLEGAGMGAAWLLYIATDTGLSCEICEGYQAHIDSCEMRAQGRACHKCAWVYHNCAKNWPKEETTIRDIVGKLVKWGSISEPQMRLIDSLLKRIGNRAEIEARRRAEKEAAAPCPTGRVTITGTVLKINLVESTFGYRETSVVKIFLKDDRGFTVYGTCPTIRLEDIKEAYGTREAYHVVRLRDRISFSANVTPADSDPKHGFYSRPTKGELIQAAQEVVNA